MVDMSVGAASITAAIDRNTRKIAFAGDIVWFRKLVSVVTTGYSGATPANMVLLVYRGTTLVALAQSPSVPCTFSLDTNTSEMEDVMELAYEGGDRDFDVFIYDAESTSQELLGSGKLKVYGNRDYSATSPIPPLSATTIFIGSFAFYNGKTYQRSVTDNLYYESALYGTGTSVTEALSPVGITIPGAP